MKTLIFTATLLLAFAGCRDAGITPVDCPVLLNHAGGFEGDSVVVLLDHAECVAYSAYSGGVNNTKGCCLTAREGLHTLRLRFPLHHFDAMIDFTAKRDCLTVIDTYLDRESSKVTFAVRWE